MTTIYLIRHAEAEGNLYRIAQGHTDGKITKRGWEQIKALSKRFQSIHVDSVYSSDLHRTCATASAIYSQKGLSLHTDPALREVNLGVWEGKPWGAIAREDPEQLLWFSTKCHLWRVKDGETAEEVQTRLYEEVCNIARRHDGQTVAIVSHGFAIRMLLGKLQGYPLERIGESPQEDNTAVSLLEFTQDKLNMIFRSDDSHLFDRSQTSKKIARRRTSALETGMYYQPLSLPLHAEFLYEMSTAAWREAGLAIPNDADVSYTLFGFNGSKAPSALLQMCDEGEIHLLYVRPEERQQGLGVQLIGQAAQWALSQGRDELYISFEPGDPAKSLFEENGFIRFGETTDGKVQLKKSLGTQFDLPQSLA